MKRTPNARPMILPCSKAVRLTHWGRVTHICVSKLTIIGSDNGLSPDRRQAIIWTNAGLLLIGPLGTNVSEILIEILTFSFKKMRLKVSSAKRRPFCLGLNVLTLWHLGDEAVIRKCIGHMSRIIKFLCTFCEISFRWMPQNSFDDASKSIVLQIVALCRQATSR